MKSVVIIGGGFTGTVTAINLARLGTVPALVTIINQENPPGRGIAYSARNPSHLLNVAAHNMSALADQPNHFLEWLATRSEYLDQPLSLLREQFVPRMVYGDYLQSLFLWYSQTVGVEKGIRFEWLQAEATDINTSGQPAVCLADGRIIHADKILLAVGNQKPAPLKVPGSNLADPRYIGNPWADWEHTLPSRDQTVLLIGTGLTMVDAFLTLEGIHWQGKIYAVSRNGLLPLSHFNRPPYPEFLDEDAGDISLAELFSIFKRHYRLAKARNINPAILVDKLRPVTQRLWQKFSITEKRRFNRHLRAHWNVTRHRIAPAVHHDLSKAIAEGRLEVLKGTVVECQEAGDNLRVSIETNGITRTIEAGALVNCTGPQENYIRPESRLFKNLMLRGLIQPDEMNMGIKVAPDFAVIDQRGNSSDILFAAGSILKGTLWETIAVPELRSQAFRVAETIASQLAEAREAKIPMCERFERMLEYSI